MAVCKASGSGAWCTDVGLFARSDPERCIRCLACKVTRSAARCVGVRVSCSSLFREKSFGLRVWVSLGVRGGQRMCVGCKATQCRGMFISHTFAKNSLERCTMRICILKVPLQ